MVAGRPDNAPVRIAILDDYLDTVRTLSAFSRLAGHDVTIWRDHCQDDDALAARLADTEVLVPIRERTRISGALLERLPRLRLISQRGSWPHIDVDACTRLGIVVSSDVHPGAPSHSTVELTWSLVLAAARRLPDQVVALKAGTWQTAIGTTLHGKRLGIYGYGRIGAAVAGIGRAFGMDVWTLSRPTSLERAAAEGVRAAPDRETFFAESDVLCLHLKLVEATRGIVTAEDLGLMKPSAILVNTSRADLIAPGALEAALRAGRPGQAAVDVYESEPVVGGDHALLALDDAICTPHLGYVTVEEWELIFAVAFDQITAFAAGAPINVVNPEALDGRRART
jgi:D-3-phosphoglycerate dehydrogenase / 2-oxoglutarate reductase